MDIENLGRQAKEASYVLSKLTTKEKNQVLHNLVDALNESKDLILKANEEDLKKAKENNLPDAMYARLKLDDKSFTSILNDMLKVAQLPDPVGEEYDGRKLENGLKLVKRREPLGVIGVIYEARPNVTIDITSLCIKTGNVCILRGGKETLATNIAMVKAIKLGLERSNLPKECVQYIDEPNREYVTELLHLDKYVDMIIPRGGEKLHDLCRKESTIPVIIGGFGVGHIFVDESADFEKSIDIIDNAKTQRPSACNSVDTILVHEKIASSFIPKLSERLAQKGVTIVTHNGVLEFVKDSKAKIIEGKEEDFKTEWLSLTLNLTIVKGLDEVLEHMRKYNACHSDAILTNDYHNATRFVNEVGSACAYINTSTRFSDGGQFGLGAEVAISTQKLHARGPMGLTELTTYKWIVESDYQYRK